MNKLIRATDLGTITSFAALPSDMALRLQSPLNRSSNTAIADFDGDGVKDIAVGFGPGGRGSSSPSIVTIWSLADGMRAEPRMIASGGAFPLDARNPLLQNPDGAVNLAAGHFVAGETQPMLIAAQGLGGDNQIRVLQLAQVDGQWKLQVTGQFQGLSGFAAQNNSSGGTSVAAGDVDGDGLDELIVGQMNGAATVYTTLFQILDLERVDGQVTVRRSTKPIPAMPRAFRGVGGVNLAVGDIDGDGKNEIITAAAGIPAGANAPTLKNFVRVFDVIADDRNRVASIRPITSPVRVLEAATNPSGGVDVAAGNVDDDAADEILVGTQAIISVDESTGTVSATHPAQEPYLRGLNIEFADDGAFLRVSPATQLFAPFGEAGSASGTVNAEIYPVD
jgi:hypothetical protein